MSQQHQHAVQGAARENVQLREMLSESRRLHEIALDKCKHSEQEAERAHHTIRLHVERENTLRDELAETKKALDKSRSSEALLRQQLREAHASELTAKKKLASENGGVGKARGRGGHWEWGGVHEAEIAASVNPDGIGNLAVRPGFDSEGSDEVYPLTPEHGKVHGQKVRKKQTHMVNR